MSKLELFYPVAKPLIISQVFGGNGAWYQKNGINIVGHNGHDFVTGHGDPVYATHDGIAYYQKDANGGCGVVIVSDKEFEVEGQTCYIKTIYWHFVDYDKETKYKNPIKSGQRVKTGDLIGYSDSTGFSTGDHLHFGLKPVGVGEKPNTWYNIKQDNGYGGCIDPSPYFNGYHANNAVAIINILNGIITALKAMIGLKKV